MHVTSGVMVEQWSNKEITMLEYTKSKSDWRLLSKYSPQLLCLKHSSCCKEDKQSPLLWLDFKILELFDLGTLTCVLLCQYINCSFKIEKLSSRYETLFKYGYFNLVPLCFNYASTLHPNAFNNWPNLLEDQLPKCTWCSPFDHYLIQEKAAT